MAPAADDDVVFCPSYSRPLLARGKTVVATHEAILHMYPELFPLRARIFYDRLYGWSARHAALVVCPSEAAGRDVARCYGVPSERIRIVPLAPAEHFQPLAADDPRVAHVRAHVVGSSAPFFLFVGKLSGRRNIPPLIAAFAEFKRTTPLPHKLVIVGPETPGVDVRALSVAAGVTDHLVRCPYVSDDELNALYNAAETYVSPAVYEPVCLPVLEAQAVGTPVIGVDGAGMRENTGSAALLVPALQCARISRGDDTASK